MTTRSSRNFATFFLGGGIGLVLGVGAYTFVYARGYAYLSNDPAACANCHIMNNEYGAWMKSSHRNAATCNDCHTPGGLVAKYYTKASNGFWHSYAFTTGDFHEPIQIKKHNLEITQQACRKCHQDIVDAMEGPHPQTERQNCVPCHRSVGHFTVN